MKIEPPGSSNPTSGYKSKIIKIRIWKRYLHSHYDYSIIHNSQAVEQPNHPSTDEGIKKPVVYTHWNIIWPLKAGRGILLFGTTQINPENIMLSDISQSQRTNTAWFSLYEASNIVKLIEAENTIVVAKSWGWGCLEMRSYFPGGIKSQLSQMNKF